MVWNIPIHHKRNRISCTWSFINYSETLFTRGFNVFQWSKHRWTADAVHTCLLGVSKVSRWPLVLDFLTAYITSYKTVKGPRAQLLVCQQRSAGFVKHRLAKKWKMFQGVTLDQVSGFTCTPTTYCISVLLSTLFDRLVATNKTHYVLQQWRTLLLCPCLGGIRTVFTTKDKRSNASWNPLSSGLTHNASWWSLPLAYNAVHLSSCLLFRFVIAVWTKQ